MLLWNWSKLCIYKGENLMESAGTWLPLMGLFTFILPIGLTVFVLVMLYQMNQSLKRIAESLEKK
jgi:hypothetical protein